MTNLEPILSSSERKGVSHYLFGNARPLLIAFIMFTVVVVMTTDIRLVSISTLADLGPQFFIILFCSYGMYICCADGGAKSGYATDVYNNAVNKYDELKRKIDETCLPRIQEFCTYYIAEELKRTKMHYLSVACIPYDVYLEKYAKLGQKEIDELTELTSAQKRLVKKANRKKPIRLTSDMLLTQGKTASYRSPLAASPRAMKNIVFSFKIAKMSFFALCLPLIALDMLLEPSWVAFAGVCLKAFTVVLNGFDGHKDGYNNITIHTVNFVDTQCILMQQAITYAESH